MSAARIALAFAAALVLAGCNDGKEPTYQGWIEAELIFVGPDEAGRVEARHWVAARWARCSSQLSPHFPIGRWS